MENFKFPRPYPNGREREREVKRHGRSHLNLAFKRGI